MNKYLNNDQDEGDLGWSVVKEAVETSVVMLSPVVPHITEELWHMLGHEKSLLNVLWPGYSAKALEVEKRLIVLQVNHGLISLWMLF